MKNKEGKVFEGEISAFNVAPKAKVTMEMPWNTTSFEPGDYTLFLKPSYSDEIISKKFSVAAKDVSDFADMSGQKVQIAMLQIPIWGWIGILLVLLALIYGAYRFGKGRKRNDLTELAR